MQKSSLVGSIINFIFVVGYTLKNLKITNC